MDDATMFFLVGVILVTTGIAIFAPNIISKIHDEDNSTDTIEGCDKS